MNTPAKIDCHSSQVNQAFMNVMINACQAIESKFSSDGEEKGLLSIVVSESDGAIVVEFTDNGSGMSEDTLQHIFEPFFTTKRGRGGCWFGNEYCA